MKTDFVRLLAISAVLFTGAGCTANWQVKTKNSFTAPAAFAGFTPAATPVAAVPRLLLTHTFRL